MNIMFRTSADVPSVLVIGAGMYVCGRGTQGFGTILPTLVEEQSKGKVGEIWIAATSYASGVELTRKLDGINARLGTKGCVRLLPQGKKRDPLSYRHALKSMPRPACVIISAPDSCHAAMSRDVIEAGLHLLVVKPLTPTLAENKMLVELCDQHGIYGAVEFHKRFDESNLLMRQEVLGGRLGTLLYSVVEYSQRRQMREIFSAWQQKTNIFQYLGVHYADLIHFVTGAFPRRVVAVGQKSGEFPGESSWDSIQAFVEWESPKTRKVFNSVIATSWIDPDATSAMSDQKIVIVGTKGRYQADQKNRGVQLVTERGIEEINPYFSQMYPGADGAIGIRGYGPASIRQFLEDVKLLLRDPGVRGELVASRPSFHQAMVSTSVIDAANQSLERGGLWVECDTVAQARKASPGRFDKIRRVCA